MRAGGKSRFCLPIWRPVGVDAAVLSDTVHVANFAGSTVSMINGLTNKVTATILVGTAPFGVTMNKVTGRVYVSNSGDNTVSVFAGH